MPNGLRELSLNDGVSLSVAAAATVAGGVDRSTRGVSLVAAFFGVLLLLVTYFINMLLMSLDIVLLFVALLLSTEDWD